MSIVSTVVIIALIAAVVIGVNYYVPMIKCFKKAMNFFVVLSMLIWLLKVANLY